MFTASVVIREFESDDESGWVRCRVLGFLDTSYFDDVQATKPQYGDAVELVAVVDDLVVGICAATHAGEAATLETIAIHPDFRRRRIGHDLLAEAIERLSAAGCSTLEAWTREDRGTLAWYEAEGFKRQFRYLHVYASSPEEMQTAVTPTLPLMPRVRHFHAWEHEEEQMRGTFDRVHGCNQYVRRV